MIDYITGKGFIGSRLKLNNPVWVPHDRVNYFRPEPFGRFFYCASYGNIWGQNDTEEIIKANVWWPIRILEQAQNVSFHSFVYISSSSVTLPIQTPYSRSKRAAEELLLAHDLPVCIIRPFSVTGIGEQAGHLIPTLIRSCLIGEEIGFAPDPVHDFIDIQDVADAISGLSRSAGIYEVGSGIGYTNKQVLELVEDISGTKANICHNIDPRPYDTYNWVSKKSAWKPLKTLGQSITEMVEHERARAQNT